MKIWSVKIISKNFSVYFPRFQNRRMKWRNAKERELFTSKNPLNNDYCDCQQKEETLTYCPSILEDTQSSRE